MFSFLHAFFVFISKRILLSILFVGVAAPAAAHTYFFGSTELNLNVENKHIEVIHQLTAHDIENAIAEIKQVSFSPEHPQYETFIQEYIEKHFVLMRKNEVIEMNWLGLEVKRGQIFTYQESTSENYLANLLVKNTILVDTYVKQVNTVNYQDLGSAENTLGSLTFDRSRKVAIIAPYK